MTNKNHDRSSGVGLLRILIIGSILFLAVLFVTIFHPHLTERVKFFTGNALNVLVFVVILVQAYISRKQWDAMNTQAGHMEEQLDAMKDQAATMRDTLIETQNILEQNRRAVEVAKQSIEITEKSAIYAQRAYVVAKIKDIGDYDDLLQFRLLIENTGSTPANNVVLSFAYELRDSPPHAETPDKLVVYDMGFTEIQRLGLVAPNGGYQVVSTPTLAFPSPEEFQRFESGRVKFYCWGRIVYEDIFDQKRHTDFCFIQSQKQPYGYPCQHGNEAF